MEEKSPNIHIGGHNQGNIVTSHVNGSINNKNVQGSFNTDNSQKRQNLAEAAKEIQQLLKQLEQTNPTATDADKIDYVNDETSPKFKRRAVSALQAGGEVAIEEFLDNPYVNIGKAIIKGWMKPD
ncbi:hypothetical protein ACE1CI_08285 [Aerosakkonemataceae cyanobacterium BLCC-F50]|uniref:Uncharacterized protein n=1 Tax=Floridaenema flaviceps BLCC-F50 TaxID=3153642 RepID=A0ABV4XMI2_9CYAN